MVLVGVGEGGRGLLGQRGRDRYREQPNPMRVVRQGAPIETLCVLQKEGKQRAKKGEYRVFLTLWCCAQSMLSLKRATNTLQLHAPTLSAFGCFRHVAPPPHQLFFTRRC